MKNLFRSCLIVSVCAGFFTLPAYAQCNLICNDHIHASLPANGCSRSFDADDFLENPDPTCTYSVKLTYPFGTARLNGTDVNRSHIGYTMVYNVSVKGNSCWGYVTVEDKAPPQPFCSDAVISCFQLARYNKLVEQIVDNCEEDGKSVIESLRWEELSCISPIGIGHVIRKIRSFDTWGNSGTCTDTLTIRRDSFELIKCPDDVTLNCLVWCKKANNTDSYSQRSNFDLFVFSSVASSPNYPSPEKLLDLQSRDTFNSGSRKCISPLLKVVPYIKDSVFNSEHELIDTCVSMYPSGGVLCKLIFYYNDLIFPICGSGFKIRREWRFTDWCTGEDTVCVQYINIMDKQAPEVKNTASFPVLLNDTIYDVVYPGYRKEVVTSPHDCNARFCLDSLVTEDCSKVTQTYDFTFLDPNDVTKLVTKAGSPKDCFTLPAAPNNYITATKGVAIDYLKDIAWPRRCYPIKIQAWDECFNSTKGTGKLINRKTGVVADEFELDYAGLILVCITDETPPNPVCDEYTQTTLDPEQCWSRIYAADLDNGSRDNCCDILHFAVAHMDSITHYRELYAQAIKDSCGPTAYEKHKDKYNEIIENWINCYLFNDYIDLTDCNENQLVLRVYEACGVPRHDEHIYSCSPHSWFCYNTYPSYMLWHNYVLDTDPANKCLTPLPWLCLDKQWKLISYLINKSGKEYWKPKYAGATQLIPDRDLYFGPAVCFPEFYDPSGNPKLTDAANSYAPGNTCSKRLYSDCMITVFVDDKTPPVAEKPDDLFLYCDNSAREQKYSNEYAACDDDDWTPDNAKDKRCQDKKYKPYNAIESIIENDSYQGDTIDPTKKAYGWYGCNIYGNSHPDEHGEMAPCIPEQNTWFPIYCRSWLVKDSTDTGARIDPFTQFSEPVLNNGNPGSTSPGTNKFWIWDNCWMDPTSLTHEDESYFDKCNNGWIKRTWTVSDKCGNSVSVEQKIVTKHRSDFEVLFPADKITVCDLSEDLSPEAIGRPMIMDDECELVGVNFEDQRFDIVPDACYKIIRTWKIIDWCKFDPSQHARDQDIIVDDRLVADEVKRPCVYRNLKDNGDGFMTYIQIILIRDTIAPLVNCRDTTVCIYDEHCELPSIYIPFTASDNCTATDLLSYRWEIDENPAPADTVAKRYNKNSIDKSSSGEQKALSIVQPQGVSLVHVIAEDNCGNEDTCTFILRVRDCKKPTPYCYFGVATVIMPTTGEIKVWAKDLDAGSYDNCTSRENLRFSFGPSIADSCKVFKCEDIPNGISFTVQIDIYVWDEAGNFDYCATFISIQDGMGDVCDDAASVAGSISGMVRTQQNEPVEHVVVEAQSNLTIPAFRTSVSGQYAFVNLPMHSQYVLKPSRNDQPSNGVSTIDLLMIQKHILGVHPFTSGYDMVAADVNNDKEITALDLIELRKLILFLYDDFPSNKSWRFVPKSYQFNMQAPYSFPEAIDIKGLSADELNRDFTGIKIGDLNNTVQAHSLMGLEVRSAAKPLTFRTSDQVLSQGEEAVITLTSSNFKGIEAFQFSLKHEGLQILDIQSGSLPLDQRHVGLIRNDYLTASWNDVSGMTFDSNQPLFSLRVRALKSVRLSEDLAINSMYTQSESYNGRETGEVRLVFDNQDDQARFSLYQNVPNPFQTHTLISFDLPREETITLRITDLTGKTIHSRKMNGLKGFNQIRLEKETIGGSGVYYYSIETAVERETRKMILMGIH